MKVTSDKRSLSKHCKGSNLWDMWSKWVESVRTVGFSFDGNVIEESSLDPAYTVDNVGECDYLRTEGEPGAAGYTIKEALALARSVISCIICYSLHGNRGNGRTLLTGRPFGLMHWVQNLSLFGL